MTSIRRRLLAALLGMLGIVWLATATWFFLDLRQEVRAVLDARLAEAAQMVQALLARQGLLPQRNAAASTPLEISAITRQRYQGRLACQVWTIAGHPIAVSEGAPRAELSGLESGFANREVDGTAWRVYALTDRRLGARILVGEPLEPRRGLIADVALGLLVPFGVLVPLTVVLVWYGLGRGLAPLRRLSRTIEERAADSLRPVADGQVPKEVAPLVSSINRLFVRLSEAFERERRFTGDAAHELRTPLAALKTHVQVALATRDARARKHALVQVETAVDRATRLVEQLLVLARLDAGAEGGEQATADLEGVARSVVAELMPFAEGRGIKIRLACQGRSATAPLPPAVLAIAIRNLVDNAVRYSPPGSKVIVAVEAAGSETRVEVSDEGPGILDTELTKVRERFYRGTGAVGEGSGLGLSIVDRIAERYGLRLLFDNKHPTGLVARLSIHSSNAPPRNS